MCLMIVQEEIRTQSIISEDCPCIFHPLSSATVVSSVSPLLLTQHPVMLRDTAESRLDSFNPLSPVFCTAKYRGSARRARGETFKIHNMLSFNSSSKRLEWDVIVSLRLCCALPDHGT